MEIRHHTYVPGWSSSSPCNRLLRVKSVGWYLGFCQNRQLRLTTSAMGTSFFESFTRDTWMRLPSGSIWRTKFAVALENITLAAEKWQSWKKDKCQKFWFVFFPGRQGLVSVLVPSKKSSGWSYCTETSYHSEIDSQECRRWLKGSRGSPLDANINPHTHTHHLHALGSAFIV